LRAVLLLLLFFGVAQAESLPAGPLFMGYYESWNEEPVEVAKLTRLAQLPDSLDIVAISFLKPDLAFDGDHLRDSGLQNFTSAGFLRDSIEALRKRNPKVKVLLSVGGSNYGAGWPAYDAGAVARLVKAVGADGVDLDFEPEQPACSRVRLGEMASILCASDADWQRILRQTRAVLPRPFLLTAPGWSVGAYGEGAFSRELPASRYTGSMLWLKRAPEAKEIDLLTIMAYDAGPTLDPDRAFAAYRAIWAGRLLLGMSVPPDAHAGLPYTATRMKHFAGLRAADQLGGIMLWAATSPSEDGPSLDRPDGELAIRWICQGLGRVKCN
jgi:chitinase